MRLLSVVAAATAAQAFAPTRAAAPTVCRGGKLEAVKNSAFVFVKPHAVTPPTIELVKSKLEGAGLTILQEGDISSEDIDSKKLVDQHYYAIASKATITPPAELVVPEDKFTEFFGESWASVLHDGRAFTAIDACKELGLSGAEMDEAWGKAKGDGKIIKLGGGFYAGQLQKGDKSIYTFNAFYMSMRDRFTVPGGSIHYFAVEWDAATLAWADFRGKLLGPTDPAAAPADSIRGLIYSDWKKLGLSGEPNTGDNGVHASASPFEGLAEKMNWLEVKPSEDAFGASIIADGLDEATLAQWILDPVVTQADGKGSLFDALEDSNVGVCSAKLKELKALA
jgi:nucleoside diphosphate kinase